MKNSKLITTLGLLTSVAFSTLSYAEDIEVHDADPRNTAWRGGIATDDNGEIKLVAGGGFNNLYGGDEYATQTIMIGEYFTQSENFRFRLANFDERFGGIYIDTNLTEAANFYTAGFMLPLTATNGTTMLFPSVNYSYIDIDTNQIAKDANASMSDSLNGYSTGTGQSLALNNIAINGGQVRDMLGGGHAHMASVNLYGLQPWNDTHYTVFQAFGGSSYGGADIEMVDLMVLQGIRTNIGDAVFNVYLEGKYTSITVNNVTGLPGGSDSISGDETKVSIGFDWRF